MADVTLLAGVLLLLLVVPVDVLVAKDADVLLAKVDGCAVTGGILFLFASSSSPLPPL